MKVRVKAHVHLAGKEPTKENPTVFEPGHVVEIDDATAKANPWAFEPVEEEKSGSGK